MNKNGDFLKKGAVYLIENIDAKLMVTNTETNYDSVLGLKLTASKVILGFKHLVSLELCEL